PAQKRWVLQSQAGTRGASLRHANDRFAVRGGVLAGAAVAAVGARASVDDVPTAQGGDVVVPTASGALIVTAHIVRARGPDNGVVAAGSRGLDAERVVVGGTAAAASDRVVSAVARGLTAGQIVPGRALAVDDDVVSALAGSVAVGREIVSGCPVIVSVAADKRVVAAVSGGVRSCREEVAPQLVVAGAAVQYVLTGAADEGVIAVATADDVVSAESVEEVVAVEEHDNVVAGGAGKRIVVRGADYRRRLSVAGGGRAGRRRVRGKESYRDRRWQNNQPRQG